LGFEWIDGESAHCDEKSVVEVAVEDFSGCFEAIRSGGPFIDQGFNELVTFFDGFCME
jgi:hypothetical protein